MVKLLCRNRQIIRADNQRLIEHNKNVDPLFCAFDDEWDGFQITVTFKNGEAGPSSLDYTEGMQIPAQFFETGELYISFEGKKSYGDNDVAIIRTEEMQYPLICHKSGASSANPPADIAPDVWDRAIAKADESLQKSNQTSQTVSLLSNTIEEMKQMILDQQKQIEDLKSLL